jgi:hypothetical protein
VDRVGQVLHPVPAERVLDEPVERLELAHTQPVALAQLALQGAPRRGMTGQQPPPLVDEGAVRVVTDHGPDATMRKHKMHQQYLLVH